MVWYSLSAMRGRARNAMSLCTSIYKLSRGKRLYWAQGFALRPFPDSSRSSHTPSVILIDEEQSRKTMKKFFLETMEDGKSHHSGGGERRNPAFKPELADEDDLS